MSYKNFRKTKKAQLFSVIAILLIGLMFLSFEIFSQIREKESTEDRISTMNSFLNSIEKNLERQMFIAGFRIIFLAEDQITKTNNYINDIDAFFYEGFYNGTVNGIPNNVTNGATYDDLVNSIKTKGDKISVDITIENSTINITQDDPWHVKFTIESDFVMEDKRGLAKWEKRQKISAYIPITDFEDPIYFVSSGCIPRRINQTIYEEYYVNGSDVSNLSDHFSKGYYAANSDAPSFLKRLEGDLSADPNGIETFVNTLQLSSQSGCASIDDTKSVADHIYFNPSNPTTGNIVTGMPPYFKIDDGHKARYQIP